MANTYTQLYVHCEFAVRYRDALIHESFEDRLHKYITGIVQENRHKMIKINGMPDHLHMVVGMHPGQSVSDMLQDAMADSSKFVNKSRLSKCQFNWRNGFDAFSISHSDLPRVIHYVENQKIHHSTKTFREEVIDLYEQYQIDYDNRFLFKDPE